MKKVMMEVNCRDLVSDPVISGHLAVDQTYVDQIAANFDEDKVSCPVVASLDGKYYLVDGVHTVEAMKKVYADQEHKIHCFVYFCTDWEDVRKVVAEYEKEKK